MNFRILLVEDSPESQLIVRQALSKSAEIVVASTLGEAQLALENCGFDLILLDLSLPDGDGMEFFSMIQGQGSKYEIPVIFLTAKDETAAQVAAFSLGAEDYVVKPPRPLEFRARIEAKLSRIARMRQVESTLSRGALRIELAQQKAYIEIAGSGTRSEVELTGREFKILYYMAKSEGTIFTRDQLISAIWGQGVHVLDRTVDTHVYTLRKKLGEHAHYVESEVGLGYRFNSSAKRPIRRSKCVA